ncbi:MULTISPECIES: hypothetical protein [Candidatus Regiella]|uniref:hypothetical protein n=1 Tax=Candidatus Regiella TaxID=568988 RepID=UPI000314A6E0|nr:hypothetical protein [Candidatus Regiella insecticola]
MSLEALGQVVAKAAPLWGSALGGSASATMIDSSEELIQRVESDPQAHLKLIEIQSNHEIELQRIQLV